MDGEKGSAIINNRVVEVGDTIDGALVKSITIDKVILTIEDKEIVLKNK